MSECTHNCSTCSSGCGSSEFHRDESLMEKLMPGASVKKVIAVVSGKGGVGKSMVTSLLAAETQRRGFRTAILDADLTGPSIPKAFGVSERMRAAADHMLPVTTPSGIQMVSMNLLLDAPEEPVLWRGPVIAGVVAQFWSEVMWDDVDYMFIDLPPGTGDVPLTVMQGLPLDRIVIVSSPQDLVGMIVEKAVKMARMMKVPVLSLVENMSYFICPDCGKVHEIFGESKVQKLAAIYGIDAFIRLPINPDSARLVDEGRVEDIDCDYVAALADAPPPADESAGGGAVYAGLLFCGGHMPSSVTASLRKSREMHHSAASPTRVYTTRLTVAVWPPNSHATISKRNSPMLPQLSPPTMANISAMRSIIMGKTPLLFYRGYFPRIAEKYAFDKTSAGATFLALYKNTAAVYYLITAYPIGLFERPAHIFIPPAGDPSCHLTWRAASARRFFMCSRAGDIIPRPPAGYSKEIISTAA